MNHSRLPFIDWMKCLGMAVIVYGHTAGGSTIETQPFNPKQLGVAFFLFVLGFSLSREQRPRPKVLYNRLFDVYFVGVAAAVILSLCAWFSAGDLAESNYLPFLFGVNVALPYFPANPTTWYIGTYIHALLIWALVLRGIRIRPWMLVLSVMIEVLARAALIQFAGSFIAYMALTNWMTVLLLGQYCGQQQGIESVARRRVGVFAASLVALLIAWIFISRQLNMEQGFPFSRIQFGDTTLSVLTTSASVTLLYTSITLLVFSTTRGWPDLSIVRLFARNTLIVFIAHMPLLFLLAPLTYPLMPGGWFRAVVNMLIYYVLLTLLSEVVLRIVPLRRIREGLYHAIASRMTWLAQPAPAHLGAEADAAD